MVLMLVKTTAGLDRLTAGFSDPEDDGFVCGMMCGGCARRHLAVITERPVPDLFVGQGTAEGITALDTMEQRHALLNMLGNCIH
jgi:hypothetical protein